MNIKKLFSYLFLVMYILFMSTNVEAVETFTSASSIDNCNAQSYTVTDSSGVSHTNYNNGLGTCALFDSNGNPVYCLSIGLEYIGGVTFTNTNSELIDGKGMACGILKAIDAGYLSIPTDLTTDIYYFPNVSTTTQYEIQHRLWDYQFTSSSCSKEISTKDNTTNIVGTLEITPERINLTREAGSDYYKGQVTINHSNLLNGTYTIRYGGTRMQVSTSDGGATIATGTSLSAKTLYIRIPASEIETKDAFQLEFSGSYRNTKTTTTTYAIPVIRVFYPSSSYPTSNYQKLGKIGIRKYVDSDEEAVDKSLYDSVIFDVKPWGNLKIIKKDSVTGEVISGAKFKLYDSNGAVAKDIDGNTIGEKTTNSSGVITISKLPYGTYTLKETSAAAGYVDTEVTITGISINSTSVTKNVTNDKTKTIISKQDITTGQELPGAKLTILDENKKVIIDENGLAKYSWISGTEPFVIQGLPDGIYYLEEQIAPSGYAKSEMVRFEVKSGEVETKVVMKDSLNKVIFSKVDATTGKELPGAHLQILDRLQKPILDDEGNVKYLWVSTDEPHIIDGLPDGEYYLEETIAPDGYTKSEMVKFEVKNGVPTTKVVMKDSPIVPVENTASNSNLALPIVGSILLVSGAGIIGYVIIRKKKF